MNDHRKACWRLAANVALAPVRTARDAVIGLGGGLLMSVAPVVGGCAVVISGLKALKEIAHGEWDKAPGSARFAAKAAAVAVAPILATMPVAHLMQVHHIDDSKSYVETCAIGGALLGAAHGLMRSWNGIAEAIQEVRHTRPSEHPKRQVGQVGRLVA